MDPGNNLYMAISHRAPVLSQPAPDAREAAVAIIIWDSGDTLFLLYVTRSKKEGDPWSGHIAFPGGRIERYDEGPQAAAERETSEEVGLILSRTQSIGRLDDLSTNYNKVHVAGFAYLLQEKPDLILNGEIQDAYWISIDHLKDSNTHLITEISGDWGKSRVPAINLLGSGHPVLWGLTYRFSAQILSCLGCELPGGSDVQIINPRR